MSDRPTIQLSMVVNGFSIDLTVEPREPLAYVLRQRLGLTGTKVSCDSQSCGTCTVLVDDKPVSACTFLAADADGQSVRTIEGVAKNGELHPLQRAFVEHGGLQCGFCTPGMIMASLALLEQAPRPTREDVVHWLEGNVCRCTGYQPIVEAVLAAAEELRS